jgi:hypothetical protein
MLAARTWPNAIDLAQSIRRRLDHVEHLLAEGAHKLFRIYGANAPDHSGREVYLDTICRSRGRCAKEARFELLAGRDEGDLRRLRLRHIRCR